MEEINQIQDLNSHYTTSSKVEKPQRVVVNGPENIPKYHLYTDREANEKLQAIEYDVYEAIQKTAPTWSNRNAAPCEQVSPYDADAVFLKQRQPL